MVGETSPTSRTIGNPVVHSRKRQRTAKLRRPLRLIMNPRRAPRARHLGPSRLPHLAQEGAISSRGSVQITGRCVITYELERDVQMIRSEFGQLVQDDSTVETAAAKLGQVEPVVHHASACGA